MSKLKQLIHFYTKKCLNRKDEKSAYVSNTVHFNHFANHIYCKLLKNRNNRNEFVIIFKRTIFQKKNNKIGNKKIFNSINSRNIVTIDFANALLKGFFHATK